MNYNRITWVHVSELSPFEPSTRRDHLGTVTGQPLIYDPVYRLGLDRRVSRYGLPRGTDLVCTIATAKQAQDQTGSYNWAYIGSGQ